MKTYLNTESGLLTLAAGGTTGIRRIDAKRGDLLELEVVPSATLTDPTGILAAKVKGTYSGDPVALDSAWTPPSIEGAGYLFSLSLNTTEINALFTGETGDVTLMAEITWTAGGTVRSSQTFDLVVARDVWRGDEGAPAGAIDLKATQAEAEELTDNTKWVTPLRVAQAIAAWVAGHSAAVCSAINATVAPAWANVSGKPTTFAPVIGGGAGDAVAGNDSRLADARTPIAHTHAASDITDSTNSGRSLITAVSLADNLFLKTSPDAVAWTKTGAFAVSTGQPLYIGVLGALLTIPASTVVVMPGSPAAGTDYAIWARVDGVLEATANHTSAPAVGARKLGGFHYAPGGNAAAQAGGDSTPAINTYSFWDLKFRPACSDARGMALIAGGFWCDIYMPNTDCDLNGTSAHNVTIADGSSTPKVPTAFGGNGSTTYGNLTWFSAAELGSAYGKRLMSLDEFQAAAYGVTEGTARGTDPVTTGLDAARTSRWGIMQATGNLSAWCLDSSWRNGTDSATVVGTATSGSAVITALSHSRMMPGTYVAGTGIPANAYILSVDPVALTMTLSANATATNAGITISAGSYLAGDLMTNAGGWAWRLNTGSRGSLNLNNSLGLVRALAGGDWAGGSVAGSRASLWFGCPWNSGNNVSARFRSDHLRLV